MKALRMLLIVLGILIALPLVVALFVKTHYAVERSITINQPKQIVFDYVKFLKNQDQYSKWATMDANMKKTYRGEDGQVGFVSAWESQNPDVGKGEQEIVKITDGERIDFELRFFEPWQSKEPAYMTTSAATDSTTLVKWGFSGHMDYPMNLFLLFMDMEKMIGDDLATGLNNLKNVMEKK